jgi:hypothetical protein
MGIPNVFNSDLFTEVALTETIMTAPLVPLGLSQYFEAKGSPTKFVWADRKQNKSVLFNAYPRGGTEGNHMPQPTRDALILPIPHIPVYDEMLYDSWMSVRKFGSESETVGAEEVLSEKSLAMAQAMENSIESFRLGALRGVVKNGDGTTLLDINTTFNITRASMTIDLNGPDTIKSQLMILRRNIQKKLGAGYPLKDVVLLVGFNAFSFLAQHAEITEAYDGQANNRAFFRDNQAVAGEFRYADVTIKLYDWDTAADFPSALDDTGSTVADMEGLAFPVLQAGSIFKEVYGPGDTAQTYNVMGQKFFMNRMNDAWDLGIKLRGQSNPLVYNTRPDVPYNIDFIAGSTLSDSPEYDQA